MKILIPVLNFGKSGGYRVLSQLANELINVGHQVKFMSSDNSLLPYYSTIAPILWVNKKGKIVSQPSLDNSKDSAISILRKLYKGLKQINTNEYDVILANHSLTCLPIKKAHLLRKTIYYVQAYEPDFYEEMGGIKNKILAYFSRTSYNQRLFSIVNAGIYKNYKNLQSTRVLYPGIDFRLFCPKANNEEKGKKIIIGTIGRQSIFKGTHLILEAYRQLKVKHKNIELHIAFGNQELYKDIEGVYCPQPHGDQNLAKFYQGLDYYFCAQYSQTGGFHFPVVEAMACGIPLITTKYYPANEQNAWILPPKNTKEIISQFEEANSNNQLREKKIKQGLMDIQQFDWKNVIELFNIYLNEFKQETANE